MRAEGAVRAVTSGSSVRRRGCVRRGSRAVVDVQAERDDLPLVVERQGAHLRVDSLEHRGGLLGRLPVHGEGPLARDGRVRILRVLRVALVRHPERQLVGRAPHAEEARHLGWPDSDAAPLLALGCRLRSLSLRVAESARRPRALNRCSGPGSAS